MPVVKAATMGEVKLAYAILRNQRVELGKTEYVQHIFAFLRPGTAPAG